jgi:thiamine-monophosphate kinase
MPLSEFEIIASYFQQTGLSADASHPNITLGIGDDCALLTVSDGHQMAVSMDVLVEGVHFPTVADANLLARRALAVNLSDLAAMGATPLGFMLGLTLPTVDENWLAAFAKGLRVSSQQYKCPLIGGNLTRGPLQIAIQVQGQVPTGLALLRSGAKTGDAVYVSGTCGMAGLALEWLQGTLLNLSQQQTEVLRAAYYLPEPRLALGQALRGLASAAQDVSDGLLADLGHIARQSKVKIVIQAQAVPLAGMLTSLKSSTQALQLALTAGDDYELIFTAPVECHERLIIAAARVGVPVSRIGIVQAGSGVEVLDATGYAMPITYSGYDHFGIQV